MEGGGGRGQGSAEHPCQNARRSAVAAHQGAKARGEGHAVDIYLGGQGPVRIAPHQMVKGSRKKKEQQIAGKNRPDIPGMLSHGGKGKGRKNHPHGGAGKASPPVEVFRQQYISQKHGSVNADIDKTKRHAVAAGEVAFVARIRKKAGKALKAASVQEIARQQTGGKKQQEKEAAEKPVRMPEAGIDLVVKGQGGGGGDPHGAVEQIKEEKAQHAEGQAPIVKIIPPVPGLGAGQNGGGHKSQNQDQYQSQHHALAGKGCRPGRPAFPLGIAEQQLTDKGAEAGAEHADMQVFVIVQAAEPDVQKRGQKAGPQIQKVQAVEGMGNYQKKAGEGVDPGITGQKDHKGPHSQAAKSRIQEGGGHAAHPEIIRNQRAGRNEDADKIRPQAAQGAGIESAGGGRRQQHQGKAKSRPVNDLAVFFLRNTHERPPVSSIRVSKDLWFCKRDRRLP